MKRNNKTDAQNKCKFKELDKAHELKRNNNHFGGGHLDGIKISGANSYIGNYNRPNGGLFPQCH